MLWRGLVFFTAVLASLVLAWAGFSYIWDDEGLNPYIAFPAAVIIHVLAYLWMAYEAEEAGQYISDYLEWLDRHEYAVKQAEQDYVRELDVTSWHILAGYTLCLAKSRRFWDNIAQRHL